MIGFINDQRAVYGVVSICRVLLIATSTYYHRLACLADPSKASARHQRDTELRPEIKRVWDESYQVYGVRKAWHQLKREGFELARCTVERLMKQVGIRGAVRGKVAKTTIPDTSAPCPRDKVNRVFRAPAPNLLWVSDFTYVSTWQGFVYVAFVVDTFADRIVGWRVSRSAKTDFVLPSRDHAAHDPAGHWMLWSRPCTIDGPSRKVDWFTIRTAPLGTLLHNALPGSGRAIFVNSLHRAFG
tara:strand:- start:347 stop:1072 length:726 start_codon:yes stop_codon:yes gene_type:complete